MHVRNLAIAGSILAALTLGACSGNDDEEETPVVDETPAMENEAPAMDEGPPAIEGETPAMEGEAAPMEEAAPAIEDEEFIDEE